MRMSKKKETKVQKKAAPKKETKAIAKKKDLIKKTVAKQKAKKATAKPVRAEITVHVDTRTQIPTETQLAEPMKDGKAMTLQPTWIGENQLLRMLQRTPKEQIYTRQGRGKDSFDYVTGIYCIKWLNFVFGWNWDWEVTEHGREGKQVWCIGRLTVRGNKAGQVIIKTGFGRSEVKQLRDGKGDLDYGNDLKAASTDAMKKAASLLGFASDIYGKADYKMESGREVRPELPAGEPTIAPGDPSPKTHEFEDHVCQYLGKGGCGKDLTKSEAEYSKRVYNRKLCKQHYPNN